MLQIAVINESTAVADGPVQQMIPAFSTQWNTDLNAEWGVGAAQFVFTPKGTTPAAGAWWVVFLDNSDQALSGYHTQAAALAAGASYTVNGTFTTTPATAPGTYTLFVKADGLGGSLGGGDGSASGFGRKVRGLKTTADELPDYVERVLSRFAAGKGPAPLAGGMNMRL